VGEEVVRRSPLDEQRHHVVRRSHLVRPGVRRGREGPRQARVRPGVEEQAHNLHPPAVARLDERMRAAGRLRGQAAVARQERPRCFEISGGNRRDQAFGGRGLGQRGCLVDRRLERRPASEAMLTCDHLLGVLEADIPDGHRGGSLPTVAG
jgi:hypothetical protein